MTSMRTAPLIAVPQKANGAVSKTEAVEDMLRAALKCDELGARVRRPPPPPRRRSVPAERAREAPAAAPAAAFMLASSHESSRFLDALITPGCLAASWMLLDAGC
jgi:hypothetical protein